MTAMSPDWTQAPEGATHYNIHNRMWYRGKFDNVQVWMRDDWFYSPHGFDLSDKRHFTERPA